MPIIESVLVEMMTKKVAENIERVTTHSPLNSPNPSYFKEMCKAIAKGVATATPSISFTTNDVGSTAVPPVPGVGTGVGIIIDKDFFTEQIYTRIRASVLAKYGKTVHDPYPPTPQNLSGQVLKGFAQGIAEAIYEHFKICWTLSSNHPIVYAGTGGIAYGGFSGINANAVKDAITANSPNLKGGAWGDFVQSIAIAYQQTIHTRSSGSVLINGICIPSPSQVCGIFGTGTGSGVAS
jgi:hypothetical protein